MYKGCYSIGK